MGKNLIIKGADFEANRVRTIYSPFFNLDFSVFTEYTNPLPTGKNAGFVHLGSSITDLITNAAQIKGVRLKTYNTGTIPVYLATFASETSVPTKTLLKTFTTTEAAVITDLMFDTLVTLSAGQKIMVGSNTEAWSGRWYYGNVGTNKGLYIVYSDNIVSSPDYSLGFDYLIL